MSMRKTLFVFAVLGTLAACTPEQSSYEGQVKDEGGRPLGGVTVYALQNQPMKGYDRLSTSTDSNGSFRLTGLYPKSNYQLVVGKSAWECKSRLNVLSPPKGQTGLLEGPFVVRILDVRDHAGVVIDPVSSRKYSSTVCGWIDDLEGVPIANLSISAKPANRQIGSGYDCLAVTDETGKFTLSELFPQSEYQIVLNTQWKTSFKPLKVYTPENGATSSLPRNIRIAAQDNTGSPVDLHTNTPRFRRQEGNIIEDGKTGLIWLKMDWYNVDASDVARWITALRSQNGGGYEDWRFPTKQEVESLMAPDVSNSDDTGISQRLYSGLWSVGSSHWIYSEEDKEPAIYYGPERPTKKMGYGTSWGLAVRSKSGDGQPADLEAIHETARKLASESGTLFDLDGWKAGERGITKEDTLLFQDSFSSADQGTLKKGTEVVYIGSERSRYYVLLDTLQMGYVDSGTLVKSGQQ